MKEILTKEFNVFVGADSLTQLSELLIEKSYAKVFVLVDNNTKKYCLPLLKPFLAQFQLIEIKAGEIHKNIQTAQFIWQQLQDNNADRTSLLINLGGGVICDMGGFAAATFKRGIDFIHVPTSLLGMVDASIGGKLGVDFNGIKNEIGLFKHPHLIVVNEDFLKTLPKEELKSGFAELVKHSLVADKKMWYTLQTIEDITPESIKKYIYQSIKIKVKIVRKDPTEKGIRKALNFGHTIGHAIESASILKSRKPILHGHAIAVGMIVESWLSCQLNLLSTKDFNQIEKFLSLHFNRLVLDFDSKDLIKLMGHDKKNENGKIQFSLIHKIGSPKLKINCEQDLIQQALTTCLQLK